MPEVKIKHIVSFSSEDKPHKAENLLSSDTCRKWNCTPAEKQASVIFQLKKSTQISSIDIGNDGSAFIEVLVGRSSTVNVQYQVLLVASSFMSPHESRQGQPTNRVRIFDENKLSPEISTQKWDLVKIVCTQPFNKRVSYGLSFIKLHTLSGDTEDTEIEVASSSFVKKNEYEPERKTFGGFKLKKDSDLQTGDFHPGFQMLMAKKWNDKTDPDALQSAKSAELPNTKGEEKQEMSRGSTSAVAKEFEQKRRKIGCSTSMKKLSTATSTAVPVKFDTLKQKKAIIPPKPDGAILSEMNKKLAKKHKMTRPFDQIFSGVVFAISGFQNPQRSEIREKMLLMGAQYRKDWTQDATHLICAFLNTPKYRQVSLLGGKIVRKEWVEDCSNRRQLVSWRKYSMDPSQSSGSSSEEEEKVDKRAHTSTLGLADEDSLNMDNAKQLLQHDDDDPYAGATDEEGDDTEGEIEKIQKHQGKSRIVAGNKYDNPYDASTDEEGQQQNGGDGDGLPILPDFFDDKLFLLYGSFATYTQRLLKRLIVSCGGKISEYMNDDVGYVITEQPWDNAFERALASNAGLVFVKPAWVYQCGMQENIVPHQPYVVPHT